jgi:hypothetical protein
VEGVSNCFVGNNFKAANAANLSAWNIRSGTSIAGVPGQLKTNCRNTVNSAYFNYDFDAGAPLSTHGHNSGTQLDPWDTVDDFYGWSLTPVSGWASDTLCDAYVWVDKSTTDGGNTPSTCDGTNPCAYQDQISNLLVSTRLAASADWPTAIDTCASSQHGGYPAGSWRLPTQRELMSLYEHGIVSIASTNFISLANMQTGYWSASSDATTSNNPAVASSAWQMVLASGATTQLDKSQSASVICVK